MESPDPLSPSQSHSADLPDFALLRALFPPDEGFRHKMGLQRREFRDFYAPTVSGPSIAERKAAILDTGPALYVAASEAGWPAFREFATILGLERSADGASTDGERHAAARELSLRIEPDYLLLLQPDWTLVFAGVCFPSHWTLEGKLHRRLHEIHSAVPGLNEGLGRKIALFFDRMIPGEGWRRANWGLSASSAGNQHPCVRIARLTADSTPDTTFLRVEDQHLLKLPRTGAIAFGIRVSSFRLSDIAREPDIATALRQQLRTMPEEIVGYKGLTAFLATETP